MQINNRLAISLLSFENFIDTPPHLYQLEQSFSHYTIPLFTMIFTVSK